MTVATDPRKTGINAGMTQLASSAVAVSVTGTTNETVLATITIPAGAMGINGGVMIHSAWTITNNANTKTLRIRLNGIAGTAYLSQSPASVLSFIDFGRRIRNRNSASSQVGIINSTGSTSGGAVVTSSIDTTVSVDLVITAQLGVGTDTATLESYEVWLLP